MYCISAAQCVAREKAINAAMDVVIERDARERVEVTLKGCLQLCDGVDALRIFAPLTGEGRDRLGVQEL
jgi:hypothetical protein